MKVKTQSQQGIIPQTGCIAEEGRIKTEYLACSRTRSWSQHKAVVTIGEKSKAMDEPIQEAQFQEASHAGKCG